MASNKQPVDEIDDKTLAHRPFYAPWHRCWLPDPAFPLETPKAEYARLEKIARVLHFEDYSKVFKKGAILPNTIIDETHSSMPNETKGSWFGVSPTDGGQHNWYGNVSCQVDFKTFLKVFQLKYYFIEVVEYRSTSTPRLLLTTQSVPEDLNVTEYDPSLIGGPWFINQREQHFYLKDIRRFKNIRSNDYSAELELFIILSPHEYKLLYKMCDIVAVNHSDGNCSGYRKCKKYRSGGKKLTCPSAWNIENCQNHLDQRAEESNDDD